MHHSPCFTMYYVYKRPHMNLKVYNARIVICVLLLILDIQ